MTAKALEGSSRPFDPIPRQYVTACSNITITDEDYVYETGGREIM